MNTVYFDSPIGDDLRRERIFQGQLFVFSPNTASAALRDHARDMLTDAFAPHEPEFAQFEMSVEEFVAIMAPLKPRFIHDARTKELLRALLEEIGCDMEKTYFDVPRIRVMTSDAYLTSGVGYTLHAHRDVWYSQPMCQLNWWMPVYDFESEGSMAFHLPYWGPRDQERLGRLQLLRVEQRRPQGRSEAREDRRAQAARTRGADRSRSSAARRLSGRRRPDLLGRAPALDRAEHVWARSRFSVDFRTAHLDDLRARGGPENVDNASTGTNLRDLMQGADLSLLPDDVIALYETEEDPEKRGELVFRPS